MQQRDGRVWIRGLQLFGVFNEEQNKFDLIPNDFKREQGIVYQTPTCLYEDREGNVWVGTRNNGLYRTNPAQQYFTNISHTNWKSGLKGEGTVMSFIQTGNGDLLTGTWGDGLYRYDKNFSLLPLNIKGYIKQLSFHMGYGPVRDKT
jgi:ligand-binding sensor domain-containing protein